MTATVSGCGGGTRTVNTLVTPSFGVGTYQVLIQMPSAVGAGCTITVTDNLGRSATSPQFKVLSTTLGANVNANIHNAPGWAASHAYSTTGARALNGAGWTPGSPGHFNPGSALNAYQLTSGSCISAASGGPSGTGSSINDGTCTWKYLSGVDYITLSGWNIDAPFWVSGKTYTFFETMTVNDGGVLRAYQYAGGGNDTYAFCTSTVAPTGIGAGGQGYWTSSTQTTADGCSWGYLGDVTYSSQVASIPAMTWVNNNVAATAHMDRPYTAILWNDAEYVAGSAGERNPITSVNHQSNALAMEGNVFGQLATITIMAATGESFADTLTTSTPLAGYDTAKGVSIRNPNSSASFAAPGPIGGGNAGILAWDFLLNVSRIQVKAVAGAGIFGFNGNIFSNNIIDGGSFAGSGPWCMAVWVDNIAIVANNLILNRGCIGVGIKYGNSFMMYNTIVNVGSVSNTAAFAYTHAWVFQEIVFANNIISGFAHVTGENPGLGTDPINPLSVGNVTDTTGPDNTGTTWWIDGTPASSNVVDTPGTTFGVSAASMFVAPGSDYRPGTATRASGSAFGPFYVNCAPGIPSPPCTPIYQTWDTPDILGNIRPQ